MVSLFCPHCGGTSSTHALAEGEADQKAISDLKKQVAEEQNEEMRALLKSRLGILEKEVQATADFQKELEKATAKLHSAIARLMKNGQGNLLINMNPQQLRDFLINEGLGDAITFFQKAQLDIVDLSNKAMLAIDPTFVSGDPDLINATISRTIQSVFDDALVPEISRGIKDAVSTAAVIGSIKAPLDALAQGFQQATRSNTTEARLKIAEFGRSVQAVNAEQAGLDLFIYVGPKDGITRPFCRKIISKGRVFTKDQILKMNNGQGAGPVITTAGGYNCRHSWSPVSKGFAKVMGLDVATNNDIRDLT